MFLASYPVPDTENTGTVNSLPIQRAAQQKPRVSPHPWHLRLQRKNYKIVRLWKVCESACRRYLQPVRNCSCLAVDALNRRASPRQVAALDGFGNGCS